MRGKALGKRIQAMRAKRTGFKAAELDNLIAEAEKRANAIVVFDRVKGQLLIVNKKSV